MKEKGILEYLNAIIDLKKKYSNISFSILGKKDIKSKPDCALVLAWNLFKEIEENNSSLADKFISIKDIGN